MRRVPHHVATRRTEFLSEQISATQLRVHEDLQIEFRHVFDLKSWAPRASGQTVPGPGVSTLQVLVPVTSLPQRRGENHANNMISGTGNYHGTEESSTAVSIY